MNKEKQIQLRQKVNELFFKKNYQNEKLLKKKKYLGILLFVGLNQKIRILQKIIADGQKENQGRIQIMKNN